eukprot:43251-Chlamydomonas_euryale.AAC.5
MLVNSACCMPSAACLCVHAMHINTGCYMEIAAPHAMRHAGLSMPGTCCSARTASSNCYGRYARTVESCDLGGHPLTMHTGTRMMTSSAPSSSTASVAVLYGWLHAWATCTQHTY